MEVGRVDWRIGHKGYDACASVFFVLQMECKKTVKNVKMGKAS